MKVNFCGLQILMPKDFLSASRVVEMCGNEMPEAMGGEKGDIRFFAYSLKEIFYLPTLAGIANARIR
jgi:hypothetical protein